MMREWLWVKFRLRQSGHLFHCDFVPSNEDPSSFDLVLKLNDNGTRQFPFLRRSILELVWCLVHWNDTGTMMKWHWNDVGMRLEWRIEIFNGMTAQWCENDFESSLGSVNWSIYFHYSLVSHHPKNGLKWPKIAKIWPKNGLKLLKSKKLAGIISPDPSFFPCMDHWTVVSHTFHKATFSDRFLIT